MFIDAQNLIQIAYWSILYPVLMGATGKQLLWAGITLVLILGAFKAFDEIQRNRVASQLEILENAVADRQLEIAKRALQAIEKTTFISPSARSSYDQRIERISPQVLRLSDRIEFTEKLAVLDNIRFCIATGAYEDAATSLAQTRKNTKFDDGAIREQFNEAVDSIDARLTRIQSASPFVFPTDSDGNWQKFLKHIEKQAEINARYRTAPEHKWIGTDRRKLSSRKRELVETYYNEFLHDHDFRQRWNLMAKNRSNARAKIHEYVILKEMTQEKVGILSFKKSRESYEKKISKLEESIKEADEQMLSAMKEFLAKQQVDVNPESFTTFVEIYGLDPLFCLDYTSLSIHGLHRLDKMASHAPTSDPPATRIRLITTSMIEQWGTILREQCRHAEPDMQVLANLGEILRSQALDQAVQPENIDDWFRDCEAVFTASRRWLADVIAHPQEATPSLPSAERTPLPVH